METELKLSIEPTLIESFCALPLLQQLAVEAPHSEELVSTYFDTPDLLIRRRNAGLRVRSVRDSWVQTFKAGGSVASGLHRRHEWEFPVRGSKPDIDALLQRIDDPEWGKVLRLSSLEDRLEPVFSTRISRMIWLLRLETGDEIELALDQGTLVHGHKRAQVHEIELELKAGDAAHLFEFALRLLASVPLRLENRSKAERGYALHTPQAVSAVKASPLTLSHKTSQERGFCKIIENCLTQVQANETGVGDACEPESIHQMRVGLRRLRSALRLFAGAIPVPATLQQELDWLAAQLGVARDWDVLSESTLSRLADIAPADTGIEAVRQAASDKAREKREQAAAAVKSIRYAHLMLSLSVWLQGAGWRKEMDAQALKRLQAPLQKFADKILAHDQARLHKRGKHLQADAEARHRVRIAAKKTRYAAEFFQSLYPTKRVRPYVAALCELQDELGWLNDAAVADHLLQEFQHGETAQPDLAHGAGFARGYLSSAGDIERPKLLKMWKRFVPLRPPCVK